MISLLCLYFDADVNNMICNIACFSRNQQEVRIYDTASDETPPSYLRIRDSRHSRTEGITKVIFIPPSSSHSSTQILTGGYYGTVSLWTIPKLLPRRKTEPISSLSAQCIWSIPAFTSKGEGVCDMMVLPLGVRKDDLIKPSNSSMNPLVLLAGSSSSLTLLDTSKCTRKAFSTAITPSFAATWDLYQYISKELSIIDPEAKIPARRWIAAQKLSLIRYECTDRNSFQIGIVLKCGWIIIAELNQSLLSSSINIRIQIVHHTPRIQCFNSSNEQVATLGGMALQFCLPDLPIPATNLNGAFLLGDVKQMRYTLPSKDKYVLGEEHGVLTAQPNQSGEGLIIITQHGSNLSCRRKNKMRETCICARLPVPSVSLLSLVAHPSGEWIVISYGRGAASRSLELVTMRKLTP